jgi:hypothetical protein
VEPGPRPVPKDGLRQRSPPKRPSRTWPRFQEPTPAPPPEDDLAVPPPEGGLSAEPPEGDVAGLVTVFPGPAFSRSFEQFPRATGRACSGPIPEGIGQLRSRDPRHHRPVTRTASGSTPRSRLGPVRTPFHSRHRTTAPQEGSRRTDRQGDPWDHSPRSGPRPLRVASDTPRPRHWPPPLPKVGAIRRREAIPFPSREGP